MGGKVKGPYFGTTIHGNTEKGVIPKDIRKDLTDDFACLLEINELKQVERVLYREGVYRTKTRNKE